MSATDGVCDYCEEPAYYVHHKTGTTACKNHQVSSMLGGSFSKREMAHIEQGMEAANIMWGLW